MASSVERGLLEEESTIFMVGEDFNFWEERGGGKDGLWEVVVESWLLESGGVLDFCGGGAGDWGKVGFCCKESIEYCDWSEN